MRVVVVEDEPGLRSYLVPLPEREAIRRHGWVPHAAPVKDLSDGSADTMNDEPVPKAAEPIARPQQS